MTKSAPHLISTLDLYQTSGLRPSVVDLYMACAPDFFLYFSPEQVIAGNQSENTFYVIIILR